MKKFEITDAYEQKVAWNILIQSGIVKPHKDELSPQTRTEQLFEMKIHARAAYNLPKEYVFHKQSQLDSYFK